MTVMPFLTPQSPLYPKEDAYFNTTSLLPSSVLQMPIPHFVQRQKTQCLCLSCKKNAYESQWRDTRKHSHIMLLVNV